MKRMSITQIKRKKKQGHPLVMVTCYDATFARLVEQGDVDMILIGDSLGMVIQGHEHTLPVTLNEIIYHSRAVARGCQRPHLVADLPFGTYQSSTEEALKNATRLMKEGGVQSVKLEGGTPVLDTIHRLTQVGIPVMGHLGLTPQSVHQMGGYKVQGKTSASAERLIREAKDLQEAGAYALVLEGIPTSLAQECSSQLTIPTIGIGAGPYCDGQVLVLYDLLGLDQRFNPKFVKKYDDLDHRVSHAVRQYAQEVREKSFPTIKHSH